MQSCRRMSTALCLLPRLKAYYSPASWALQASAFCQRSQVIALHRSFESAKWQYRSLHSELQKSCSIKAGRAHCYLSPGAI